MNINKNNTVISDHYMLMSAEGQCDQKPTEVEIKEYLNNKGWISTKIQINYDDFQKIWRWSCRIS